MKHFSMTMKSSPQKNTLLQVAQANAETKTCKRVFFSPTQEKLKNKKFPSLLKNKTSQPHSPRQTDTNIHGHLTVQYLGTLQGNTDDRRAATNSTYKKLAVQWLNEALCFVSSSVVADSFRLRNRQLLVAANRYMPL